MVKIMNNSNPSSESDVLVYNQNIKAFISEVLAAEQRILIKQDDTNINKSAISVYKECIFIRELFTYIANYYNLALCLSNEQYTIVKRVWYRAFDAALLASQCIKNESTITRIELNMAHAVMNINTRY